MAADLWATLKPQEKMLAILEEELKTLEREEEDLKERLQSVRLLKEKQISSLKNARTLFTGEIH
jgi:hypothetical protein